MSRWAHRQFRPLRDALFEDGERHRPFLQHVVECLHVELVTQRRLGCVARAHPGDMANLVAARLPDLGAISLHFALAAGAGVLVIGRPITAAADPAAAAKAIAASL